MTGFVTAGAKALAMLCLTIVLALPAQAQTVLVLNSNDDSLSVLSLSERREIERRRIGRGPHHLTRHPGTGEVIVGNTTGNELVFLDGATGKELRRMANIPDPYQIGFSPDGKWMVLTCNRLHWVDIYDAATLQRVARVPARSIPSHIAFDRASSQTFITLQDTNLVMAVDLASHTVLWQTRVGAAPAGIVMTPDDRHLLVGNMGGETVSVIDWRTGRVTQEIRTGKGAHNLFLTPEGDEVLVTNRVAGTITRLDWRTLQVIGDIRASGWPDDVEFSPDRTQLWVTSRVAKRVQVIDRHSQAVVGEISVGRSPHGIYIHQP
ncbi:MAG: YncE family protein [Alphaproteobacteria bacterium]|nr:MAG: YncE family protein [Alphaproteobacteria bacterium]